MSLKWTQRNLIAIELQIPIFLVIRVRFVWRRAISGGRMIQPDFGVVEDKHS